MKFYFKLFLVSITLFVSCENKKRAPQTLINEPNPQIDSTNSFKIDNYWITPKKSFELNSINKNSGDTLSFVTCSDYIYSPFGNITNKSQLTKSKLKNFSITNRIDTLKNGVFEFQILQYKNSRLILFFDDDPEASKGSYVHKGEIRNIGVNLSNNIKIGMTEKAFLEIFLADYSKQLLSKYNVIILESCVEDIKHIYTFKNGELESIIFKSSSWWKIDY